MKEIIIQALFNFKCSILYCLFVAIFARWTLCINITNSRPANGVPQLGKVNTLLLQIIWVRCRPMLLEAYFNSRDTVKQLILKAFETNAVIVIISIATKWSIHRYCNTAQLTIQISLIKHIVSFFPLQPVTTVCFTLCNGTAMCRKLCTIEFTRNSKVVLTNYLHH